MTTPQLFTIERGLQLDSAVSFTYGVGAPGNDVETIAAGKGSIYSEIGTGGIWKKIAEGAGTGCWEELITNEPPVTAQNVVGKTQLDKVPTAESQYFVWGFSAHLQSNPAVRFSGILTASNNRSENAEATECRFERHSVLKHGSIPGIKVDVELINDPVAGQCMAVVAEAGQPVSVTVYRILKNYVGTRALGSVTAAVDPLAGPSTVAYQYNAQGQLTECSETTNGVTLSKVYTYNGDGTVHTLATSYSGRTRTETYTYDGNGNVAGITAVVA